MRAVVIASGKKLLRRREQQIEEADAKQQKEQIERQRNLEKQAMVQNAGMEHYAKMLPHAMRSCDMDYHRGAIEAPVLLGRGNHGAVYKEGNYAAQCLH